MFPNNKENIKINTVFVIGEIERVALDYSNQLPKVSFKQNNQPKSNKLNTQVIPSQIFTQENTIVVIDRTISSIQKTMKRG
jgi:hypothetical protein